MTKVHRECFEDGDEWPLPKNAVIVHKKEVTDNHFVGSRKRLVVWYIV